MLFHKTLSDIYKAIEHQRTHLNKNSDEIEIIFKDDLNYLKKVTKLPAHDAPAAAYYLTRIYNQSSFYKENKAQWDEWFQIAVQGKWPEALFKELEYLGRGLRHYSGETIDIRASKFTNVRKQFFDVVFFNPNLLNSYTKLVEALPEFYLDNAEEAFRLHKNEKLRSFVIKKLISEYEKASEEQQKGKYAFQIATCYKEHDEQEWDHWFKLALEHNEPEALFSEMVYLIEKRRSYVDTNRIDTLDHGLAIFQRLQDTMDQRWIEALNKKFPNYIPFYHSKEKAGEILLSEIDFRLKEMLQPKHFYGETAYSYMQRLQREIEERIKEIKQLALEKTIRTCQEKIENHPAYKLLTNINIMGKFEALLKIKDIFDDTKLDDKGVDYLAKLQFWDSSKASSKVPETTQLFRTKLADLKFENEQQLDKLLKEAYEATDKSLNSLKPQNEFVKAQYAQVRGIAHEALGNSKAITVFTRTGTPEECTELKVLNKLLI